MKKKNEKRKRKMAKSPPLTHLTGLECIKYKINNRNLILLPDELT
jgi:hypothetical protein